MRAQTTPTQAPSQTPKTAPQVKRVLPSYEGQNVSSLELAGQPNLNENEILPLLSQRAGQPFSQQNIDASIVALKQTGRFHDVELEVQPEAEGVRVQFVLQPAYYFGIFDFPGALKQYTYSRLIQVANYPPRGPYSAEEVRRGEAGLKTFFQRSGFFLAQVQTEMQTDAQHGLVNLIFHTKLGKRAKFGNVDIAGTSPEETKHLQDVLHSALARIRGSAIRQGKTYKLKTVQNATLYLENALNKQGHLAAQVRLMGANYHLETNRADVSFNVQTGPMVHVKVTGAHVWSWTQHKLLPVYAQIGVNPELIQEGRQNLLSYFQSKGYFDAVVRSEVQENSSGENILYEITKGPRHSVEDVSVNGNEHLPTAQLMAQIKVKKERAIKLPVILPSNGNYSEQLARQSVSNLKKLYQANGFRDVQVTPQVSIKGGNVYVKFHVDEGAQDLVESLKIEGNETQTESQLAPQGLRLAPGKAFSQVRANQDRTQIMAHYLSLGYLNATFHETAHPVSKQSHQLNVVYSIYEGPQVHTATVVTLGRKATKQKLIDRNVAEIKPGQPLTQEELFGSSNQLYTVGIFDWAQVDPRRQITTQNQEDVIVKVHEAKPTSMVYGFGFEVINRGGSVPSGTVALPGLPPVGLPSSFKTSQKTFYGPTGSFEYTFNNLLGKAETLGFSSFAGRLDQRASIIFANPNFLWSSWGSNVSISGEHNSLNPIFTSLQAQSGFQFQKPLKKDKSQNVFLRYSLSETGLTQLLIPALVPATDRHVRLSTVSGTYIRETRDNSLDAHKGIYESLELDVNPSKLGSNFSFAKLLAQTAYYKKIPKNIIWANSLRIGLEQPFSGHVPLSEEFFSGGGSTLRGFSLNGAGPQRGIPACGDPADRSTCSFITVPVGGNELLILNSELRIPFPIKEGMLKGLGAAVFYDGGNVYPRIGFHDFVSLYSNTVGAGLRYNTPVGPVRIDIGHNLNAPPGIKSTQLFITIGQAF